ncbi:MAG TPA: hypothetical protein VFH66_09970 [Mycobacteriales bacterium]|nr:hypothetical protein [Mycobacteriales bacterium]
MRRGMRGRIAAAVALLAVVWLAVPASVPIYDGINNPDEPYRYVQPPIGAKATPLPTSAETTIAVGKDSLSGSRYCNSAENGPQVDYYVPAGSLKAPPGATAIAVKAVPTAPGPPLPADGTITGNVYRITASTPQGAAVIVGHSISDTPTLDMRAPSAKQPGPVFEHLSGGVWKQSATLRIGQDVYQTSAAALGGWALVQLTHPPSTSGGGGVNVGLLAAGLAVLALVGVIVMIRVSRARRS